MPRESCSVTSTEPHHLVFRNQPLRPDVIQDLAHLHRDIRHWTAMKIGRHLYFDMSASPALAVILR
jgi:hypothetical protein